jgi:homoserine O-succinyltransferase/O-acetyltransferase
VTSKGPINVALVNNMPDAAFLDTEHQFRRAVAAGDQSGSIELTLYAMPGIQRANPVAAEIRSRYHALDDIYKATPDALIVTGTEPAQTELQYEPYWPHLSQLLHWAAESVPTSLLSCLAAHASLLMFDGLSRQPLPTKCSGVFTGRVEAQGNPLAAGLPAEVAVPHSRVNDVPQEDLVSCGYSIVIGSDRSGPGWSVATRSQGNGVFVLCQGHPEYSTESLLREYRRDIRRFLFGRGAVAYPAMPKDYFSADALGQLDAFAARAADDLSDPSGLYESFPYEEIRSRLVNTWAESSAAFYRNWLGTAASASGASAGASGAARR